MIPQNRVGSPSAPSAQSDGQKAPADKVEHDRRHVLAAMAKFSACVAPMTYVLLDAKSAGAEGIGVRCSTKPGSVKPGENCDL